MVMFSLALHYFAREAEVTLIVFFQNGTLETIPK